MVFLCCNFSAYLTVTISMLLTPYNSFHVEDEYKIKKLIHHSPLTKTKCMYVSMLPDSDCAIGTHSQ